MELTLTPKEENKSVQEMEVMLWLTRGGLQPQCFLHLCFAASCRSAWTILRLHEEQGCGWQPVGLRTESPGIWSLRQAARHRGKRVATEKYTKSTWEFDKVWAVRKGIPVLLGEDWTNFLLDQLWIIYSTRSHMSSWLRKQWVSSKYEGTSVLSALPETLGHPWARTERGIHRARTLALGFPTVPKVWTQGQVHLFLGIDGWSSGSYVNAEWQMWL